MTLFEEFHNILLTKLEERHKKIRSRYTSSTLIQYELDALVTKDLEIIADRVIHLIEDEIND